MYFATLLDKNYIPRASVMIESLKLQLKEKLSCVFILCLDDIVYNHFQNKKNITLIRLNELECYFPELLGIKKERKYVEFIFTLSPFLPIYILENFKYVSRITTLDADLFFLDSPFECINTLGTDKIGITKHDFPNDLVELEIWGKYNVSFQSFPHTNQALSCLNKWADNCINYCGDDIDELGRFADQKYLDDWEIDFPNIVVFQSPNIGLAPWNIKKYKLEYEAQKFTINQIPIVFYHFHELRFKSKHHITIALHKFLYSHPSKPVIKLYSKYCSKLQNANQATDRALVRNNSTEYIFSNFYKDIKVTPILLKIFNNYWYIDFRKYFNLFK